MLGVKPKMQQPNTEPSQTNKKTIEPTKNINQIIINIQ